MPVPLESRLVVKVERTSGVDSRAAIENLSRDVLSGGEAHTEVLTCNCLDGTGSIHRRLANTAGNQSTHETLYARKKKQKRIGASGCPEAVHLSASRHLSTGCTGPLRPLMTTDRRCVVCIATAPWPKGHSSARARN
jgi:hypothetical protein